MPGGYGQIGTPWGRGGTTARTERFLPNKEFNEVAEAVNKFQLAKRGDESPEVVQDLQNKAIDEIAWQQALSGADTTAEGRLDRDPAEEEYGIIKQNITDRIAKQQPPPPIDGTGILGTTLTSGQNLLSQLPSIQMLKGITGLFNKAPTLAQLRDPRYLSIMKNVLTGDRLVDFENRYSDLIAEAYGEGEEGEGFREALETAADPEEGSELQKIIDPKAYWEQTIPYTQGDVEEAAAAGVTWIPGYGPVERPEGAGGGGGGAGIANLAPLQQLAATTTPATTAATTSPATTAATAATVPAAIATAPTPFDYSQWPQYTQQGIANPNFNPWYNTLQNYYGVG